jgi:CO/xanthine dehydrogenase FAD-binding subunit
MKDFKYLRPTTLEEAILLCTGYVKIIQFIGEAQRPCGSG